MDPNELQKALAGFSETNEWHKHESGLHYTDAVRYLADVIGAHWLIDLIASHQKRARKLVGARRLQIWRITVDLELRRGFVQCLRHPDDLAFQQDLPFTDFPLSQLELNVEEDILCLPNER